MSTVTNRKCDECGKRAPSADLPDSWRELALPFNPTTVVDVCSPGCAKRQVNVAVNQEWEVPDRGDSAAPVPTADLGEEPNRPEEVNPNATVPYLADD